MKRSNAFTLAEVLITLMLVGVIAAFTIPLFLQEFQKNRWTVTFKRTFAETINALSRIALEEDCSKNLTCTHLFDNGQASSTKELGDALTKVMATSKNCGVEENSNCFAHEIRIGLQGNDKQNIRDTLQGTLDDAVNFVTPFYTFVTQRGVSYAILSFGNQCLNNGDPQGYVDAYVTNTENENNQMLSLCGFIVIDVNSIQPPNVWGRDVFGVWITDRSILGVYPFGGEFDKRFGGKCLLNNNADTRGCAAQLVRDGWVMKY